MERINLLAGLELIEQKSRFNNPAGSSKVYRVYKVDKMMFTNPIHYIVKNDDVGVAHW